MDRLKGYLKPNFKPHPFNYFAAVLVFVWAFTSASIVYAFEDDGTYEPGWGWQTSNYGGYGVGNTVTQACADVGKNTLGNPPGACDKGWGAGFSVHKKSCASLLADWGFVCSPPGPPPPSCNQGDQVEIMREISAPRNVGDELTITINGGSDGEGSYWVFHNGCQYTRSKSSPATTGSYRPLEYEMAGTYEIATWEATGETAPEGVQGPPTWDADDESAPDIAEENVQLEDESSTTEIPESVTQVGTDTVTESGTIERETVGKGTVIDEQSSSVTVDHSEGIEKTVTTTIQTIQHEDGSTTEVVTTETAYVQKPNEKIIWDRETGNVTVVDGWEGGSSQTETVTTRRDSGGNVTGTTTTRTGTGSDKENRYGIGSGSGGDGSADQIGDEFCQQNPTHPDCVEANPTGPDGDGLYKAGDKTYADVFGNFKNTVTGSGIVAAGTGFFDMNISSGSCPVWSADVPMFGSIVIDHLCHPVMNSVWPIIQAVIILIFSFAAFRVALLQ